MTFDAISAVIKLQLSNKSIKKLSQKELKTPFVNIKKELFSKTLKIEK
jgi:ribosomal protein L29